MVGLSIAYYAVWRIGAVNDGQLTATLVIGALCIAWAWFEYFVWVRRENEEATAMPPSARE